MIKRWFQFVYSGNRIENTTRRSNGSANHGLGLMEGAPPRALPKSILKAAGSMSRR
jgi:hypothetical protein